MPQKYPPGPRDGLCGITFYGRFRQAPLEFATEVARQYGDFAFVRIGWVRVYFVNRPELIREVLVTKAKSFRKERRQMDTLSMLEGQSVNTAEGAIWRRHRPVVQSAFHARHFDRFARVFVDYARRRAQRWTPGVVFDMAEDMKDLALEIIAKVLFDVDWADRAARLREAVHVFRTYMQVEICRPIVLPEWLPLPGKIRQRRAVREIDEMIWDVIRRRRASAEVGEDLLSLMLAAAHTVKDGPPISDREIRDEAVTLFVAGYDTTSASLAWFWYLLAKHPEVEQRVLREVDQVLGDRPATLDDLHQLRFLGRVVKESMRLYPASGFLFGREALEDVDLGGFTLRRGSWVLISPYIIHHNADYFENPEVFDPDRFAPDRVDRIPAYAHMTFGAGPRTCIGNQFAVIEATLIAASVLQRYRLELDPTQPPVEAMLEIVLRPRGSVRMRAVPRAKSK
jgi:cytochrome P450